MNTFEIILSAIIVVLGFVLTYNWKKLKKFQRRVLSSIILLTIILTIVQISNKNAEKAKEELIEKINSKFGDLDFDGEPINKLNLGQNDNTGFISSNSSYGAAIIHPEYGPVIRVSTIENRLNVNVIVRDFNGEVIAVIDGDTWTVFNDNYEYNDDGGKAFELVTKGERKVFFQIQYKNESVHVAGYFITKDKSGYAIFNKNDDKKNTIVFAGFKNPIQLEDVKRIFFVPRLFKYPRSKYYGQRL